MVEPIQGEAGVFVPDEGYLKSAYNYVQQQMCYLLQMRCKQELRELENF